MDNYSHKAYFKNAPEGNGVVPTGAYNNEHGFQVKYTASGRVKYITVQSGKWNNFANQGFKYGSGSMYLGQEKGTETFGAGESMSNGYVRYQGLMFGSNLDIAYVWLESNGVWSSVVIEAMPVNDPDKDLTQDPF